MKLYEAVAEAFVAEKAGPVFALMGSANMHFMSALRHRGTRIVRAQHENMCVAMADGHFRATGEVGVVSVTVGPGLTQLATSLMIASRRGSSLVIMCGDTEAGLREGDQHWMDQRAFAEAAGGIFQPVRSPQSVTEDVREAFYLARTIPGPVVLNVPLELQRCEVPAPLSYHDARSLMTRYEQPEPSEAAVERAVDLLLSSQRPVVVAGRGAMARNAVRAIEELASTAGALLATTLPAHGIFAGNPFDMGVIGAYGSELSARLLGGADCVVAFGASLSYHTTDGDRLFPDARVISVNLDSRALVAARRAPDQMVVADCGAVAERMQRLLVKSGVSRTGYRTTEVARLLDADLAADEILSHPAQIEADRLDPRLVVREIASELPDECVIVTSPSHSGYFPCRFLPGHRGHLLINTTEFGCIGHGMSTAIGIALADPRRPVVVFEGDGATTMNIQELHTASLEGAGVLVVVLNDEAYGTEYHRLRDDPDGAALALLPSPDFAAVAQAFRVPATTARRPGDAADAVRAFVRGSGPRLIDARISRQVVRPKASAKAGSHG